MSDLEKGLSAYLGGFLRGRPDNLALIQNYPNWALMAQQEVDRRATKLLTGLPDDELRAIASGQIDLVALANAVYAHAHPFEASVRSQALLTPSLAIAAAEGDPGRREDPPHHLQDSQEAGPAPGRR